MTCNHVRLQNGASAIVCSRSTPRRRCSNGRRGNVSASQCIRTATKLCDYPLGNGKTCDKPLCDCCAVNVGPDRDYCPKHARAGQAELAL
jgi:hypothetical protein